MRTVLCDRRYQRPEKRAVQPNVKRAPCSNDKSSLELQAMKVLRRDTRTARTEVRLATAVAVVIAAAGLFALPADARTGLVYIAVDADNDPYSGIYLRDSTSMSKVRRVPSRYLRYGSRFELICGAWGESVGPYKNRRWHKVAVVGDAGGAKNGEIGWIADRYTNTPNKANQATPREPECSPTASPTPVGVYLNPYEASDQSHRPSMSPKAINIGRSTWFTGRSCDVDGVTNAIRKAANGRPVDHMAAWSLSKITPMEFMYKASTSELRALDYVIIFDPGANNEFPSCMNGSGTSFDAGNALVRWLKTNPDARLVIIAGRITDASWGGRIQNDLFNDVRNQSGGTNIRRQVAVCEYTNLGHQEAFAGGQAYIDKRISTRGSCPNISGRSPRTPMWNP